MLESIGDKDRIGQVALHHERGYLGDLSLTIGLEEELILLDPLSLLPADEVERALAVVRADDRFHAEFRACQLELVTPVCLTVGDARRELASARAHLVDRLEGRLRIAAVGTHPTSTEPSAIAPGERFLGIARDYGWATRRGQPCGLHVHVGLTDPAAALAVYNAARSYLPELAALAANSPFFESRETGLASSRLKLTEDLPRSGIPPAFATWQKFTEFTAWGSRGGLFPDLGYLWWDLRPRPDYGTVEFRIADSQTSSTDTGALAAVCHALVAMLAARFQRGEELTVHTRSTRIAGAQSATGWTGCSSISIPGASVRHATGSATCWTSSRRGRPSSAAPTSSTMPARSCARTAPSASAGSHGTKGSTGCSAGSPTRRSARKHDHPSSSPRLPWADRPPL